MTTSRPRRRVQGHGARHGVGDLVVQREAPVGIRQLGEQPLVLHDVPHGIAIAGRDGALHHRAEQRIVQAARIEVAPAAVHEDDVDRAADGVDQPAAFERGCEALHSENRQPAAARYGRQGTRSRLERVEVDRVRFGLAGRRHVDQRDQRRARRPVVPPVVPPVIPQRAQRLEQPRLGRDRAQHEARGHLLQHGHLLERAAQGIHVANAAAHHALRERVVLDEAVAALDQEPVHAPDRDARQRARVGQTCSCRGVQPDPRAQRGSFRVLAITAEKPRTASGVSRSMPS